MLNKNSCLRCSLFGDITLILEELIYFMDIIMYILLEFMCQGFYLYSARYFNVKMLKLPWILTGGPAGIPQNGTDNCLNLEDFCNAKISLYTGMMFCYCNVTSYLQKLLIKNFARSTDFSSFL